MTASRIQSSFDSFDFDLSDADMAAMESLEDNYVTDSLHKAEDWCALSVPDD
jgi:diketogulonate reductase-like aldo/keto reductase